MDNYQKQLMIEALLEKRKKPSKEVSEIDTIINNLRNELKSDGIKVSEPPNPEIVNTPPVNNILNLFPTTGGIQSQVLAAMDYQNKPLKMSQITETIKEQTGRDLDVRETVRGMNKKFLLILMKINNSNKYSYWVKPEWYDKESRSLREQYKLQDMDILYDPSNIEYIGIKK